MIGDRDFPNTTFDGGVIEIDADKIEQSLNAIWQQASAGLVSEMPITKLCLSTMLVVSDTASRSDAEQLSGEIAANYPSRVILMIVDDDLREYSAHVKTSCSRDRETGSIRCWEVIELVCDREHIERLPGALRALIVGSLPVVSIDFRDYQNTPEFDATILRLSDYYFINAEVVPSGLVERTYLPLRWYRTYPIRFLLGELMARVYARDCQVHPVRIELFSSDSHDTYSDLLCGWLLHRLQAVSPKQEGETVTVAYRSFGLNINLVPWEDIVQTLRIEFSDGELARIRREGATPDGRPMYQATYKDITITHAATDIPLSRYVVESLRDDSEFDEFIGASRALDRIIRVS